MTVEHCTSGGETKDAIQPAIGRRLPTTKQSSAWLPNVPMGVYTVENPLYNYMSLESLSYI